MSNFPFKRVICIVVSFLFLFSDFALAAPSTKSFFRNRRPNYQKISEQNEALLNKKRATHQGESSQLQAPGSKLQAQTKIELASLKDISDIHIPEALGRITEVYNAPAQNPIRIIHFQDLHTNYDAQKNSSMIIEHLYKTYGIDVVLSEGAIGKINPSKIKALIKNKKTLDLTSKILMKSGELTGEEYIALNRDYPIQVWGVEDKEIYTKNGEQFNQVIKFSEGAQVFLNQVEEVVKTLKPVVYNKKIRELEEKELLFNDKKIELTDYLDYLIKEAKPLKLDIQNSYPNISLLQKSLIQEKSLNPQKTQEELKLYLTLLNQNLNQNKRTKDLEELTKKSLLFNQQKLSPIKFYGFIKSLGEKNNLPTTNYKNFTTFIDYIETSSKIETYKLFMELQALSEELKYKACQTDDQKTLLTISKNLSFLKDFFNLKVSNEQLEYFLNNKDTHKVSYFKDAITGKTGLTGLTDKTGLTGKTNFIDYNPQIIDNQFSELENFYKVVWQRDKAIINNSLKRLEDLKESSAILIVGGFHTKGMTALLREQNISYIVLSANTDTGMDEELYHELISGKRKNIVELIPVANELINEKTLRIQLLLDIGQTAVARFKAAAMAEIGVSLLSGEASEIEKAYSGFNSLIQELSEHGVSDGQIRQSKDSRFIFLAWKENGKPFIIKIDTVEKFSTAGQESDLEGAESIIQVAGAEPGTGEAVYTTTSSYDRLDGNQRVIIDRIYSDPGVRGVLAGRMLGELTSEQAFNALVTRHNISPELAEAYVSQASGPFAMAKRGGGKGEAPERLKQLQQAFLAARVEYNDVTTSLSEFTIELSLRRDLTPEERKRLLKEREEETGVEAIISRYGALLKELEGYPLPLGYKNWFAWALDQPDRPKGSPLSLLNLLITLRDTENLKEIPLERVVADRMEAGKERTKGRYAGKPYSRGTIRHEFRSLEAVGIITIRDGKIIFNEGFENITSEDAKRMNEAAESIIPKGLDRWTLDDLDRQKIANIKDAVSSILLLKGQSTPTQVAKVQAAIDQVAPELARLAEDADVVITPNGSVFVSKEGRLSGAKPEGVQTQFRSDMPLGKAIAENANGNTIRIARETPEAEIRRLLAQAAGLTGATGEVGQGGSRIISGGALQSRAPDEIVERLLTRLTVLGIDWKKVEPLRKAKEFAEAGNVKAVIGRLDVALAMASNDEERELISTAISQLQDTPVAKTTPIRPVSGAAGIDLPTAQRKATVLLIDFGGTIGGSGVSRKVTQACLSTMEKLLNVDPELTIHIVSAGRAEVESELRSFSKVEKMLKGGRFFIDTRVKEKYTHVEEILGKGEVHIAIGDDFSDSLMVVDKSTGVFIQAAGGEAALDALKGILEAKRGAAMLGGLPKPLPQTIDALLKNFDALKGHPATQIQFLNECLASPTVPEEVQAEARRLLAHAQLQTGEQETVELGQVTGTEPETKEGGLRRRHVKIPGKGVMGSTEPITTLPGFGGAGGKLTVLIVDDDPDWQNSYKNAAKKAGWGVTIAPDGQRALGVLESRHRHVDAIIIDYNMPEMDGGELILRLKELDISVPIRLVTVNPETVPGKVLEVLGDLGGSVENKGSFGYRKAKEFLVETAGPASISGGGFAGSVKELNADVQVYIENHSNAKLIQYLKGHLDHPDVSPEVQAEAERLLAKAQLQPGVDVILQDPDIALLAPVLLWEYDNRKAGISISNPNDPTDIWVFEINNHGTVEAPRIRVTKLVEKTHNIYGGTARETTTDPSQLPQIVRAFLEREKRLTSFQDWVKAARKQKSASLAQAQLQPAVDGILQDPEIALLNPILLWEYDNSKAGISISNPNDPTDIWVFEITNHGSVEAPYVRVTRLVKKTNNIYGGTAKETTSDPSQLPQIVKDFLEKEKKLTEFQDWVKAARKQKSASLAQAQLQNGEIVTLSNGDIVFLAREGRPVWVAKETVDHIREAHQTATDIAGSRIYADEDILTLIREVIEQTEGYGLKTVEFDRMIGTDAVVSWSILEVILGVSFTEALNKGWIQIISGQPRDRDVANFNRRAGRYEVVFDALPPELKSRVVAQPTKAMNVILGSVPQSADAFQGADEVLAAWESVVMRETEIEDISQGIGVITAFPGKAAPKFPEDPRISDENERREAMTFWERHVFVNFSPKTEDVEEAVTSIKSAAGLTGESGGAGRGAGLLPMAGGTAPVPGAAGTTATTNEAEIRRVVEMTVSEYSTQGLAGLLGHSLENLRDLLERYLRGSISLQEATTQLVMANPQTLEPKIAQVILIAGWLAAKHNLFALGRSGIEAYLTGTPFEQVELYLQTDNPERTPEQVRAILAEADIMGAPAAAVTGSDKLFAQAQLQLRPKEEVISGLTDDAHLLDDLDRMLGGSYAQFAGAVTEEVYEMLMEQVGEQASGLLKDIADQPNREIVQELNLTPFVAKSDLLDEATYTFQAYFAWWPKHKGGVISVTRLDIQYELEDGEKVAQPFKYTKPVVLATVEPASASPLGPAPISGGGFAGSIKALNAAVKILTERGDNAALIQYLKGHLDHPDVSPEVQAEAERLLADAQLQHDEDSTVEPSQAQAAGEARRKTPTSTSRSLRDVRTVRGQQVIEQGSADKFLEFCKEIYWDIDSTQIIVVVAESPEQLTALEALELPTGDKLFIDFFEGETLLEQYRHQAFESISFDRIEFQILQGHNIPETNEALRERLSGV